MELSLDLAIMKGIEVLEFRTLLLAGRERLPRVQSVQSVQSTGPFVLNYGADVIHRGQLSAMARIALSNGPPVMCRKLIAAPIGAVSQFQLGTL